MKIVHIITAFGIGGAEKLLLGVMNQQVKNHEVFLIYFKNKNDLINQLDKRIKAYQVPFSFSMIKEMKLLYKAINPDIIHTHLGHADLLGVWSARKTSAKVFCTMHNIYFKKNILDTFFFKMYSFLFLKKGHIISISKSVETHVLKKLKIPNERSHLLYNAISNKELKPDKKPNVKCKLLFVGRLEKQKSVNTLLSAINILKLRKINKEFELKIVGDGSLRSDLEKQIIDLQVDDVVKFEGEQKDVDSYYTESDIFILPSIWEGFGIVILEAFRAKIAVIASNIEGPSELIENDKSGLLFKPKDSVELANKIEKLLLDSEKRERIAQNGFLQFSRKYHLDVYVEKLNNLYINA